MARIEAIEHRLLNWARWVAMRGSGGLGYATVDLLALADVDAGRSGYITATIPVAGIEASDTRDAVQRLPSELRATVECHYLGAGTQREKLMRLCCTARTLQARIERAHWLLSAYFTGLQDRRRGERERVEHLQRDAVDYR